MDERRGVIYLIHLDVPYRIWIRIFINENCAMWMYNDVELRSPESSACGYHVIAFCLSRINSMPNYDYISMLSENFTLNDFFVIKWLELAVHLY